MKKIFIILSCILIIISLLSIRSCNSYKNKNKISEQNLTASLSEVKKLKTKNGELYYEKESYILKTKDLEKVNKQMYESINILKEKINSGVYSDMIITDTIVIKDSVLIKSTDNDIYNISVKFSDSKQNDISKDTNSYINGIIYQRIKKDPLTIYSDSINYSLNIPIEVYFTKDYNVILKSKNKNVSFSNVDAFISPDITKFQKNKRWGLGIHAGVGPVISTNGLNIGGYIGIGVSYDIISW